LCAKIQLKMAQIKSWTVSDALWSKIGPLVPARKRPRAANTSVSPERDASRCRRGRFFRRLSMCFAPAASGRRFQGVWQRQRRACPLPALAAGGLFLKIWKAGLAEYDDMEGIAWRWQSVDGATGKAPLARECVGPNSTDRGKKWAQAQSSGGRPWHPAVARRQRSQPA